MIALDTNVLVRFLVEDDPVQAAKATALIEKAISEDSRTTSSASRGSRQVVLPLPHSIKLY